VQDWKGYKATQVVAPRLRGFQRFHLLVSVGMVCNILEWLWSAPVVANILLFLAFLATAAGAAATLYIAVLARPNLRALRKYVRATAKMEREQLQQGIAARRPFISIVPDKEQVWLTNAGPGHAFKATWQFANHEKFKGNVKVQPIGAIGIGQQVPLYFEVAKRDPLTLQLIGSQGGIEIEYQDSSEKHYWSKITRTPEGYTLVDSGEA
jgi:hypothetical protein